MPANAETRNWLLIADACRHDRPSQGGRFGENSMLQVRAQTPIGQYIHVSAEKLLNVLLEGDDIEQRSASLDVDEEIDVAVLMIITARD